jgi:hypothetical protein
LEIIWREAVDASASSSRVVAPLVSGTIAFILGLIIRRKKMGGTRHRVLGAVRCIGSCMFGLSSPPLAVLLAIGGGPHMLEGVAPYLLYPALGTLVGALLVIVADLRGPAE